MKQTSEAAIETAIEAALLADGYQAILSSAFTFLRHLAIGQSGLCPAFFPG